MIAQDPLSLVFIFCFLLGFGFFLVTALLGSHLHGHASAHAGGHAHAGSHVQAGSHARVGGHVQASNHAQANSAQNRGYAAGYTYAHVPVHAAAGQNAGNQANAQEQSQQGHFSLFTYLNPMSIGLFLLGFGLFGYFFHNLPNVAPTLSLLLAIASGIVLAFALLSLLNRIFASTEGSTELDVVDRTGMLGKVSITIPEKGLGEILYTSPGGVHKSIPARGLDNQRIARDQEVVVVNYEHGVAEVDTWEHFIQEEVNVSHSTNADELAQLRTLLDASGPLEMEMVMRQEPQKE
ncbi:MAG: hypothetical protein ABI234_16045 [Ktedonobacteraceae bacterium]